jgi:hypothetical protein
MRAELSGREAFGGSGEVWWSGDAGRAWGLLLEMPGRGEARLWRARGAGALAVRARRQDDRGELGLVESAVLAAEHGLEQTPREQRRPPPATPRVPNCARFSAFQRFHHSITGFRPA